MSLMPWAGCQLTQRPSMPAGHRSVLDAHTCRSWPAVCGTGSASLRAHHRPHHRSAAPRRAAPLRSIVLPAVDQRACCQEGAKDLQHAEGARTHTPLSAHAPTRAHTHAHA